MDKILIVSNDDKSELSSAFEIALRFLIGSGCEINSKYQDALDSLKDDGSYPLPSLILVLDKDGDGIDFLKGYWAELILKEKKESPSVILISFDNLQQLIRRNPQNIFLSSKSVTLITAPFSLKEIIEKIKMESQKKNDIEEIRQCLLWSCKLGERKLTHALKNYAAPYFLLVGTRYSGELDVTEHVKELCKKLCKKLADGLGEKIDVETIMYLAVSNLEQRSATKELKTYLAARYKDFKDWPSGTSKGKELYKILEGKKILLIDDEWESAKWKETLEIIFGEEITAIESGGWKTMKQVTEDVGSKLHLYNHLLPYDLILLDLYLTEKDHEISHKYAQGEVTSEELKELSSYKVIEKIRQKDRSVPILLFTATEKAYNVEIMKRVGADHYFPKEIHYEEEKAKDYYKRFKNSIKQLLSYERGALREIWRGIKKYERTNQSNKNIVSFLRLAFEYLSYFSHEFYRGCILELGNALEVHHGKEVLSLYGHAKHEEEEAFTAFVCYLVRTAVKHPIFRPKFEDALLVFFWALKSSGTKGIGFQYSDSDSELKDLKATATHIINSVCRNHKSNKKCSLKLCKRRWEGNRCILEKDEEGKIILESKTCSGSNVSIMERARYLSNFKNLKTKDEKNNHILFVYLYYALKKIEKAWKLENVERILIKYRIKNYMKQGKQCTK